MNMPPKIDMAEATRLTREGRLEEAMAVLRRALPGMTARFGLGAGRSAPSPTATPTVGPSRTTAIPSAPATTLGSATPSKKTDEPRSPGMLRRALERIGQLGSARGFSAPPEAVATHRGAAFEERIFVGQAGRRAYKLYVPSGYNGQAVPLVVMLHGCTQSPDDFAVGTRMNELAEEQTFLVAYPAQSQSANISKCWNWFRASDQQRDRGEPSLIAGITRDVMGEFAVEQGRVYIAGLSAGGAAAAVMGQTYPELYAAIGVHSGLACGAARDMPSAFDAMRQGRPTVNRDKGTVPTIVFHGDGDLTVNPVNGDQVIAQSKAGAGLRQTQSRGQSDKGISYTRIVHTDHGGRPMLEQWVLHGAGHAWSGGSSAGSFTEPRGPDASREMMRFFRQHPINAALRLAAQ
jgi:poly(hydroxyalkanoate) depolymerase family esterase